MLFRIDFEVGIYPDRVQITDRRSARFVDFRSEFPFSAPGTLIANPTYLEHAIAQAMRKALSGAFILLEAKAVVRATRPPLTRDERMFVSRALRNVGFKAIRFAQDHPSPLAA